LALQAVDVPEPDGLLLFLSSAAVLAISRRRLERTLRFAQV